MVRAHHLRVGHGPFRLDVPCAAQAVNRLLQMRHRQDLHALHAGGLLRVVRGQQQPSDTAAPRRNRHGERAAHADHAARQRELAHRGGAVQRRGIEHAAGGQDGQRDGQVVGRALFFDVRRGEVDRQAGHRECQAAGGHRRAHALAALLHGGVRQANDLEHRQPVRAERLDRHAVALNARKAHAVYAGKHMLSPSFVLVSLPRDIEPFKARDFSLRVERCPHIIASESRIPALLFLFFDAQEFLHAVPCGAFQHHPARRQRARCPPAAR